MTADRKPAGVKPVKISKTCATCRWWAGVEFWDTAKVATCGRITCGAGTRDSGARIYPVTSGAYLETHETFSCGYYEREARRG